MKKDLVEGEALTAKTRRVAFAGRAVRTDGARMVERLAAELPDRSAEARLSAVQFQPGPDLHRCLLLTFSALPG